MLKTWNKWAIFLFLFLSFSYNAQAYEKISLKQLKDGIYVVEDFHYIKENSLIYVGKDHVTLIGATWNPDTAKKLEVEIRKITDKPIREVVNTDYQPDRSGGNSFWRSQGAKIVSTQLTHDMMHRQWDSIIAVTRRAFPRYPELPVSLPDTVYPGDFQLQDGKIRVFYLGPSRTTDGVLVYFPDEKILYGGCILSEDIGIDYLGDSNLIQYPKTLKRLHNLNLDVSTIVAGHGNPVHGPELVERYMALIQDHINKNL